MTVYAPSGGGGAPTFPITNASPAAIVGVQPDGGAHALYVFQDGAAPLANGKMAFTVDPSYNGSAQVYLNCANQGVGGIPVTLGASVINLSCTAGPNNIYLNGPRTTFGPNGGTGATVHSGTGAPPNPAYTAAAGDLYFRTDTPSTANQRVYICTAGGNPGTWVGII